MATVVAMTQVVLFIERALRIIEAVSRGIDVIRAALEGLHAIVTQADDPNNARV